MGPADPSGAELRAFESCVQSGGVAVFPADTVYGLACDPLDERAVARINEIKGRDPGKPSALMYFDPLLVRELLADLGPRAREALAELLPGPVTLVVANPAGRYPLACGDDPARLGIRLVEGPLAGAGCVVLQTSANRAGEPDARNVGDVDPKILDSVDLVLDAGELPGTPSTVVDVSGIDDGDPFRILREGALPAAEVASRLAAKFAP